MLQYMSIGLGQPREKTRVQLLERMIRPVGPPPEVSVVDGQGQAGADCGIATRLRHVGSWLK